MTCVAHSGLSNLDRGPLTVSNVRQHFGAIQALAGIDFSVAPGEVVGLVGHNGAGKSTLMHILAGTLQRDSGTLSISGEEITGRYDPCAATARGIRCVFQELSLCQNLDLVENTRVAHPGLRGFGWRKRAQQLIREQLDAVFPGHGIAPGTVVSELPIGQRQMAEIARAYTVTNEALRFVILDEPTSSLGHHAARQVLDFVAASARRGVAAILISHRLDEILRICGRVVVMVDGRIVANRPTEGLSRDGIVALMGHLQAEPRSRPEAIRAQPAAAPVRKLSGADSRDHPIEVYQGEIVGLAGLDGHGQRECLRRLHAASMKRRSGPPVAYVAGDRQTEGLFPLWSITKNLSIGCLKALRRNALICAAAEASLAREWVATMGLKTAGIDLPVLSLSGGNQQKLLFARALASRAELVFLDDPLRGVDVGTKQSVYRLIRNEAGKGRSFIWYTSEVGELTNCDRVYVFREKRMVGVLSGSDITEANIIDRSFRGAVDA